MSVRGHTMCWHSQIPGWVSSINDKTQLTNALENHVTTIVTRYKGKVRGWVRSPHSSPLTKPPFPPSERRLVD